MFAMAVTCLMAACTTDLELPADVRISCNDSDECPDAFACRNGRCVPRDNTDVTPPTIVGQPTLSKSRLTSADVLQVAFVVDEVLSGDPAIWIDVGGEVRALALDTVASEPGALSYVATYAARGDEVERRTSFLVADLADTAGNNAVGVALGAVEFDFTPPGIALATVSFVPSPGNPLPVVSAAGAATEIIVTLVSDEAVVASPSLSVSGADIAFDAPSSTAFVSVFRGGVATLADGLYTPEVTWRDEAGNEGTRMVEQAALLVRASTPTLLVDQSAVRFLRSPWGRADAESVGGLELAAGPRFELAPAEPLSDAVIALPTFAFADERPIVRVRVWTDAARRALLGVLESDAHGWSRRDLERFDTDFAWVTGVDDAGNESAPVRIDHAEWVATANPPAFGAHPHRLTTTGDARAGLADLDSVDSSPEVAAAVDDDVAYALGAASWRQASSGGDLPGRRGGHALAFDEARGRLVLFGGSKLPGSSAEGLDDTWEWDGVAWTRASPVGMRPPRREGHVLVYHGGRGRVVLFGGSGEYCLDDLWEWDGSRWLPIASSGPSPINCGRGEAVYHAGRQSIVYWDGESDAGDGALWEWDGISWVRHPYDAVSGPSPRRYVAMAYDPLQDAVVLHGGWSLDWSTTFDDAYAWNGEWTPGPTSGTGGRYAHAMAFDPEVGAVVVFGGTRAGSPLDDAWQLQDGTWQPYGGSVMPPARSGFAMAYAPPARALVLTHGIGSFGNLLDPDAWSLDAAGARSLGPADAEPPARMHAAMATDGVGGGALLFGGATSSNPTAGQLGDTWRFDGSIWEQVASTGPSARVGHAMATDDAGSVWLHGGLDGSSVELADLWRWNGSAWTASVTAPTARWGHGVAYDAKRGRLVIFGGITAGAARADVREFDGQSWSAPTPAAGPQPGARAFAAMAWDARRERVIVFGGCRTPVAAWGRCGDDPTDYLGDVWAWDGAAWELLDDGVGTLAPAPRAHAAAAWSSEDERLAIHGGYDGHDTWGDIWEWDGAVWWPSFGVAPQARHHATMAFDPGLRQLVLFGGNAGVVANDTWLSPRSASRQPAVQLTVSALGAGIPEAGMESVRVRAWCGGAYAPFRASDVGAALWAWSRTSGPMSVGGWRHLTGGGALAPTLLDWQSADAAEARDLFLAGIGGLAVQCRPDGPSLDRDSVGVVADLPFSDAYVTTDYLELRVRYAAP